MKITATFDELDKLSTIELRACTIVFQKERDRLAREGRIGLADIYATVLGALCDERDRRQKEFKETVEESYFGILEEDRGDDEWTPA